MRLLFLTVMFQRESCMTHCLYGPLSFFKKSHKWYLLKTKKRPNNSIKVMKIRCSQQCSFLHHFMQQTFLFIIVITNTKFKLHTPNLYYIGKEKWKQMKPKRFLSCPVLSAVHTLSSCKKRHIRNNGLNFGPLKMQTV